MSIWAIKVYNNITSNKGDTNMFSIYEDLSNKFNGQIPNLIYFAIGIGLGIILFFITKLNCL